MRASGTTLPEPPGGDGVPVLGGDRSLSQLDAPELELVQERVPEGTARGTTREHLPGSLDSRVSILSHFLFLAARDVAARVLKKDHTTRHLSRCLDGALTGLEDISRHL